MPVRGDSICERALQSLFGMASFRAGDLSEYLCPGQFRPECAQFGDPAKTLGSYSGRLNRKRPAWRFPCATLLHSAKLQNNPVGVRHSRVLTAG
jgi:hypothetical protein